QDRRTARVRGQIGNYQRLPVLPGPPRWRLFNRNFQWRGSEFTTLPQVQPHHILYGIVKREISSIRCGDLSQSLRHGDEQVRHTMMVDDKVRHLEQSFVTTKIRVSFEVAVQTQFARAPFPPRANVRILMLLS